MYSRNYISLFNSASLKQQIVNVCCKRTSCITNKCVYTSITSRRYLFTSQNVNLAASVQENIEREKDFLVKLKHDPDVFGQQQEAGTVDEGDLQEEKYLHEEATSEIRQSTKRYANIIKDLIQRRKMKEAIDVVEVRMIKEDRVKPENYIYNLLIGACGRVGYTKKAFSLYNEMKRRALVITPGTYTALFNACANSPWNEDGLTRAKHLRQIMLEKQYEPNDTNYNAMIKAFGRKGDLATAFELVDEMVARKIRLRDDTINFLLQACVSDKDAGFRHALLVWRRLVKRRIKPSVFTYNLMLRSVRDCGLGDLETTQEVLNTILSENEQTLKLGESEQLLITSEEKTEASSLEETPKSLDSFRPNLLERIPHLGNIISLSEIQKPEDRLLLLGGMSGFLQNMAIYKISPDIKTFTQLLDIIPSTAAAEKELTSAMKRANVIPDVSFYNMLIKKRSMRFDYEGAKQVVEIMKSNEITPDLITYGVISLGCKTKDDAIELIDEMKENGHRLNTEILGAMMQQACYHFSFYYVFELMEICLRENIPPNDKFLEHLQNFRSRCKDISNKPDHKLHSKNFMRDFLKFRLRYKKWLEEIPKDNTGETHPWQQFREKSNTESGKFKDKSGVRFKPRHASLFKVKTSPKRIEEAEMRKNKR